jgi:flagellar assembly protein FliH
MTIRNYEYTNLSKSAPAAPAIHSYQEPKFEVDTNSKLVDVIHKQADSFKLDRNVVEQLGIEDREKKEQEDRLRKELERRWEKAAEQAEVTGYTRGLEEGKAEAFKAELPRVRERIEKLDQILREFDSFRASIFAANESFLMDLIAEVAGMIVLKTVTVDPDYVRRLVTTLLHQLSTKEDIKIFLSQADFANVDALRAALDKEFGKLNNTVIEVSSEIPVGGCKIETNFGVVDASIAAQLENVKAAMKT